MSGALEDDEDGLEFIDGMKIKPSRSHYCPGGLRIEADIFDRGEGPMVHLTI